MIKSHKPISEDQLDKMKHDAQVLANQKQHPINVRARDGSLLCTVYPQSLSTLIMHPKLFKPSLSSA